MRLSKRWTVAASTAALGVLVIYGVRRAQADGIPASQPMAYSGVLEENGAAVTGSRNMQLTLWSDASSTANTAQKCQTVANAVAVTAGHFTVPLDDTCTAAIESTPDLWIEVSVGGTPLPRSKLGAVPYAIESQRASEATGALAAQLTGIQQSVGQVIPAGTIMAFGGTSVPAGWLLCDGLAVSRTQYAALFTAIGTLHGSGDGTTTFNLPNLQGRFLRGADNGAGNDPDAATRSAANPGGASGDSVGSLQADEFKSHNHNAGGFDRLLTFGGGNNTVATVDATNASGSEPDVLESDTIQPRGGNETRPKNIAVDFIIKY